MAHLLARHAAHTPLLAARASKISRRAAPWPRASGVAAACMLRCGAKA